MAYRALYREYRPARFSDVIGQEHITSVLRNQIGSKKTTHAYLLCGTRGTGKTTTARILARAVNCLEPVNGEPCGKCEACVFSMQENCPDIIEIDAASNNGVDSIRDLLDTVHMSPLKLQSRVIIIDEVHMLSSAAFNALLKTLEEPPAHLMFILATTEPQKLLPTIVSRCQRFDFHRISIKDIVSNLRHVSDSVGADVDDNALRIIAQTANGGMRDALSLLDQCLSFCGDHLNQENVLDVLGSMNEGFMFSLSQSLLNGDTGHVLLMLDTIVQSGRDFNVFLSDLIRHIRALLLVRTCKNCSDLLDCSPDTLEKYNLQAASISETKLLNALQLLLESQSVLRYSISPRAYLEMVLIKITLPETQVSLDALTIRLERVEAEIAELRKRPYDVCSKQAEVDRSHSDHKAFEDIPPWEAPSAVSEDASNGKSESEADVIPSISISEADAVPTITDGGEPELDANNNRPKPASTSNSPSSDTSDPGSDTVSELWNNLLSGMLRVNALLQKLLQNGVPVKIENNILSVRFPESAAMAYNALSTPRSLKTLNELCTQLRPGTTVQLVKGNVYAAGKDTEQRLKDMFGDTLTITD